MARKSDSAVRPIEEPTYRCPGCGKMVDSRRMEEVLLHHRHVIEPQFPPAWFNTRTNATQQVPSERASLRNSFRRNAPVLPPEARVRRCGHSHS